MADPVNLQRLRTALRARRLSEADLARLSGYRPESVADFLRGRRATPEAFAVIAERVLKLRAGSLRP